MSNRTTLYRIEFRAPFMIGFLENLRVNVRSGRENIVSVKLISESCIEVRTIAGDLKVEDPKRMEAIPA